MQILHPKVSHDVLLLSPSSLPPEVCQNAQRVSDCPFTPAFLFFAELRLELSRADA